LAVTQLGTAALNGKTLEGERRCTVASQTTVIFTTPTAKISIHTKKLNVKIKKLALYIT
jgi:hypothetical protein